MGELNNPMNRKHSLKRRNTNQLPAGPDEFGMNPSSGQTVGGKTIGAALAINADDGPASLLLGDDITEDGQYSAERKLSNERFQTEDSLQP